MILLIGPLPKDSAVGVALGFQSLIAGCAHACLPVKVVDLFMSGEPINAGRFSLRRALQVVRPVLHAWAGLPSCHGAYLTISCSSVGFVRDFLIIWAAWFLRKPIILHLKSAGYMEFYPSRPTWFQFIIRHTLNRASRIISLGHSIKGQFSFVSDFDKKVVVVYNGTPIDASRNTSPRERKAPNSPLRVLYLSNMIPSKGYMDVLEAARLLHHRGLQDVSFDFCGAFGVSIEDNSNCPVTDASSFGQWVAAIGMADRIKYHGTVHGSLKHEIFKASDVFALPTQYPTEGQPISIIEAMAYGMPVCATPWKGIVEQVIDDTTGKLVRFNNPSDIADFLQELATDHDKLLRMGTASHNHYLKNFTREAHIRNMISLFSEVFGNHSIGPAFPTPIEIVH